MTTSASLCPDCVWGREARSDFWEDAPRYLPAVLLPFVLVLSLCAWLGRARSER